MVMTSHIDSDHITGLLDLFKALAQQRDDGQEEFCQIQTLWHNSFEKLHGGKPAAAQSATVAASLDGVVPPRGLDRFTAAVVASVPQGNQLRKTATQLAVPINQGAGGDPVAAPARGQKIVPIADGLTFTMLAPNAVQLKRLKDAFEAAKAEHGANDAAVGADYLNNTVPNMSSIVGDRRGGRAEGQEAPDAASGDARGDVLLESLELAGLMDQGPLPFRPDESAASLQQPQHDAGLLRAGHRGPLRDLRQRQARDPARRRARLAVGARGTASPTRPT